MPSGVYVRINPSHRKGKHHSKESIEKMIGAHKHNTIKSVWGQIDIEDEDKCWNWMGATTIGGYGIIKINQRNHLVHRVVYEDIYNSIPKGMLVCHSCDNNKCCNPKHLWLGTHKDNSKDMISKRRSLVGEKNNNNKLTKESVLEIRRLYSIEKLSQVELGRRYSVTAQNIWSIVNGITWS